VRDFAEVNGKGVIDEPLAKAALESLNVDGCGLDAMDKRLLLTIIEKFDGGPVGIDTLASAIGEEAQTLEDVYEPFLLQQGFIHRTPRGRLASRRSYEHFGLEFQRAGQPELEF
jgi:Holliday junction DNA helicase RuvB